MKTGTIYKITNTVNNKMYIGQTTHKLKYRMSQHRHAANRGDNNKLYVAMRKYGVDNFTIKALATADEDLLLAVESAYIDMFDTFTNGYNMTVGGRGPNGCKPSNTSRAKMSAAKKGKKLSAEHKAKMSAAHTGKKCSAETKAKMSAAKKGKKRGPFSAEHKAKISAAAKARWDRVRNAAS